jgi:hypothetical protein
MSRLRLSGIIFSSAAAGLVCLVLETRPRVYFEIGSGNSTKFARHAIKLGGLQTKVISVDPHPRAEIYALCDEVIRMPLAGCGKTEQGSRSDSDPFTSGFGYVHGQNEFFRSLLEDSDHRIFSILQGWLVIFFFSTDRTASSPLSILP